MSHVLVADDSAAFRRLVRAYMEKAHHEVTEAVDGLDALKKLHAVGADLLISDLLMPRMTGLELVGAMRKDARFRSIPVILLTAQAEEADRQRLLAAGVADYLVKPFDPARLQSALKKVLS